MFNRKLKKRVKVLERQIELLLELDKRTNKFVWCLDTKRVMPIEKVFEAKLSVELSSVHISDHSPLFYEEFSGKGVFLEKQANYDSIILGHGGTARYYAGTIRVDKPVPKIY